MSAERGGEGQRDTQTHAQRESVRVRARGRGGEGCGGGGSACLSLEIKTISMALCAISMALRSKSSARQPAPHAPAAAPCTSSILPRHLLEQSFRRCAADCVKELSVCVCVYHPPYLTSSCVRVCVYLRACACVQTASKSSCGREAMRSPSPTRAQSRL